MTLSRERIQHFVRLTLGCACPEEVFSHTTCQHSVPLTDTLWLSHKIDISSRLLIYVFTTNNSELVMNVLPELVLIGKDERERKGYKRFRLVIASDHPDTISVHAKKTFNTLDCIDEKIHLHIIHSDELLL